MSLSNDMKAVSNRCSCLNNMIFKNGYFEKLYLMKNLKFNKHLVIFLMIMILIVVKYKRYIRVSVCVSECVHSVYGVVSRARAYMHKPPTYAYVNPYTCVHPMREKKTRYQERK